MLNASALALTSALALATWSQSVSQSITSSYPIAAQGTLTVSTPNGDIHVTAWDGPTVEVAADKRATTKVELDKLKVDVNVENGNVYVKSEFPRTCSECELSYEVRAPRGVRVSAHTANGEVRVSEIAGSVDVATSNGNIRVTNSGGTVDTESASGSIRIENAGGAVHSKTSSGNIEISGARGNVDAHAASGDLNAQFSDLASVGAIALGTANGSVTLGIPRNAGASIAASTLSGEISGDLSTSARQGFAGVKLERTIGDGRVKINVSTLSGDVVLRSL
ncbi:MAG: DUF4097 family beta strand repeat protein [Candidatus Eremiobacteraeota bacterium]|nr:DUF4097 family beta strand repeat protein [Candidatus Eremiobacteraeota bacterium]MBV8365882.1 DUF4097 family beta strand repeat protein [Candidatus Eremiobacteraeota bacterium]